MVGTARKALAGGMTAALGWLAGLMPLPAAPPSCALEQGERHDVVRVVDGETLVLDDGQEVRLIGALASPSQADEARRVVEDLVGGRPISLRYEGRRRDRYGRILAQVLVDGRGDAGQELWLQEALVRAGQARAYTLPGNSACLRDLLAAEEEARRDRRGLWAREATRVREASDVEALLRLAGQFAIVEGRVAQVGRTAKTIYLNFGADWHRDFTASLAVSRAEAEQGGAAQAQSLAGRLVRVRGWIERRNGPLIALGSLDEVEVLDATNPGRPPEKEAPR